MITACVESFLTLLPEMKPLLAKHYDALSLHKAKGFPLDPQYFAYAQDEAEGRLFIMALRRDGRLIGYWVAFVSPGRHYQTCLTSIMDIWYVDPEHMAGKAPLILVKAVERELRRRGVNLWFAGEKLHLSCGRFFEKLGFEKVEATYAKWLEA
jgi:N-acetylglutamate synthase-like GNAT family acetyltransferase